MNEFFADLSYLELTILFISALSTSVLSAIIGMAGGITLLSIMTFFLPYNLLIPVHGGVQLVSNITRTFLLRKSLRWDLFLPFIIGAIVGAAISAFFLKSIFNTEIPKILIAILILYALFKPKKLPPLIIPKFAFIIVGFFAGILGLLIGAVGPFLAPFFLRPDISKEQLISTKAAMQSFIHLTKIPAFLYLGFSYLGSIGLILVLSVAAIFGTKYGVKILSKVNEKVFFTLFKSILLFSAIRLIYNAFIK